MCRLNKSAVVLLMLPAYLRVIQGLQRNPLVILSTISLGNNWSDIVPLSLISVVTAFSVWELKTKMLQTSLLWLVQKHW